MSLTCEIIAYRMFRSTALAAETKTTKWRRYPSSPTKLRWSQSDLNVKTIEIVRTPKTSLRSRGSRGISRTARRSKRSRMPWCVKRVSSIYANNADIFYHRSMEKDKLSILDVCGAYGQKDIKILVRSGPARSGVG